MIDNLQENDIICTMLKKRYLTELIYEELAAKMIFLGGPRQVGKTTLARKFINKKIRIVSADVFLSGLI